MYYIAFSVLLNYNFYMKLKEAVTMKRFKINIEYMVDKVAYKTNLFETEHFVIDYLATKDHIKLTVKP